MRQRIFAFFGMFIAICAMGCQTSGIHSARPSTQPGGYNFLIVHGAWGGGWAFRDVETMLLADGHRVHRPTLTGQGEKSHLSNPDINLSLHIQDIVNVILWDDMKDVVLVGHSYGGMVVTGVADRAPERIKHLVYLDAFDPEDGESVNDIRKLMPGPPLNTTDRNGFFIPTWVRPNTPPPHDVPMPAKTFSEAISLKNQVAARKIPTTYILTVDPGKPPKEDMFFPFYQRAIDRGWKARIMNGDHNVQWSKPKELVRFLEEAP